MANQSPQDFDKRLDAALERNKLQKDGDDLREAHDNQTDIASGLAQGTRIAIEFMAGTLVGLGLGLALDRYFGTLPWLLLIFTFLGFCAGILNVYRLVNNLGEGIGINRQSVLTKSPKNNIPKRTN